MIRVNTNVVQVDVVVTDKKGKVVTDLQSGDFELIEDGKTRVPEYFSFVPLVSSSTTGNDQSKPKIDPGSPPSVTDLKRTFVFLVDNPVIEISITDTKGLGMRTRTISLRTRAMHAGLEAEKLLSWFVDSQMEPTDLVAMSDTELDIGVLKSFTNDRQVLSAAIARIRDNVMHEKKQVISINSVNGDANLHPLLKQNLTVIETMSRVVDQLSAMPGRKIISLLSRGIMYDSRLPGAEVVRLRLNELIAKANRGKVTVYTMSPNGLGNLGGAGLSPPGEPGRLTPTGLTRGVQDIDGLVHLAEETGGRAIYSTNDARVGLAQVLEENKGYYLLGYNPGPDAVIKPHRIKVVVKRKGLHVQARTSAYANRPQPKMTMADAVDTPFVSREIPVVVTPLFLSPDGGKSRLLTIVHIDLKRDQSSKRQAALDLSINITGPDGKLVKKEFRKLSIPESMTDGEWQRGLDAFLELNNLEAGFYRVNVAVGDPDSGAVGNAIGFVEVDRLAHKSLAGSSLILYPSTAGAPVSDQIRLSAIANRRFTKDSTLNYQSTIYHAEMTKQVQVELQLKQGGTTVRSLPVQVVSGTVGAPLSVRGSVVLSDLPTGNYSLEMSIVDAHQKDKPLVKSASFAIVSETSP